MCNNARNTTYNMKDRKWYVINKQYFVTIAEKKKKSKTKNERQNYFAAYECAIVARQRK